MKHRLSMFAMISTGKLNVLRSVSRVIRFETVRDGRFLFPFRVGRILRTVAVRFPASRLLCLPLLIIALNGDICGADELSDSEATLRVIASRQPAVVKLFGTAAGTLSSYGSGVIVSKEGHVLTVWNHLINNGFLTAVTHDGRKFSVEIVGTSADFDVALVKLNTDPGEDLEHIDLSRTVDPEPGTQVLAFSNMFKVAVGNEPVSVVHGVIAAHVPLEAFQGRWKFPVRSPVWLIDAITNNSGAAGGLLTDIHGNPVGLIGREIRHAASRTWVNYAVPFSTLRPVLDELRTGRRSDLRSRDAGTPAALSDLELTIRFGLTMLPDVVERTPAFVDNVTPGSPADTAGLRRGDLVVLIDDAVITSVTDLRQQLAAPRSGRKSVLTINRDQELRSVELLIP